MLSCHSDRSWLHLGRQPRRGSAAGLRFGFPSVLGRLHLCFVIQPPRFVGCSVTNQAIAPPLVYDQIVAFKYVPTHALSFLRVYGCDIIRCAQIVDPRSNRLKVPRIHARLIATEMIQLKSIRNSTAYSFPDNSMSKPTAMNASTNAPIAMTVTASPPYPARPAVRPLRALWRLHAWMDIGRGHRQFFSPLICLHCSVTFSLAAAVVSFSRQPVVNSSKNVCASSQRLPYTQPSQQNASRISLHGRQVLKDNHSPSHLPDTIS